KLEPGETIVIYTDGVSEAMNPASDLYGMEHLRDFITNGPPNPTELGKLILKDVKRHANGRYQNDDITLMTFGRVK
ncbi:MAG: rsbU 1, partial [Planctomycetaceae bacterium]|nr:rsbU 1 [Planctomycetaceae bacterium]